MRMIQTGNRPRFALESFAQIGFAGEMVRKNFDGDDAVKPCIAGLGCHGLPLAILFQGTFVRAA